MMRRSKFIYKYYITPGSEWEINISATMRQEISAELNGECNPSIYDNTFEEINRLIIFNNAVPFCISKQATEANDMLRWWSTYQNLEIELQDGIRDKISEKIIQTGLNGTLPHKLQAKTTRGLFG